MNKEETNDRRKEIVDLTNELYRDVVAILL